MFKIILILFYWITTLNCLNFCGNWSQYKETKCVKVLKVEATQKEAIDRCNELDGSSSLITIHNKDEQQFLNVLLKGYNKSQNAWIGMESKQWVDGTVTDFTNWSEYADGKEQCVQMSLISGMKGQWMDTKCDKKALIVCQRIQELSLKSLKDIMENMSKVMETQETNNKFQKFEFEKQINSLTQLIENQQNVCQRKMIDSNIIIDSMKKEMNSSIPLGFIYTQLPDQPTPYELWPNKQWGEVTYQYSGLFFRAEGSGSEPFGRIQEANQSYISDIEIQSAWYEGWDIFERFYMSKSFNKNGGEWTHLAPQNLFDEIWLYVTSAEVRP